MTDNNTARFSSANQSSWQKRRKMTVSFVLVLLKPTLALRSQSKSLTRPHPFQYVVPLSRNNDVILLHTCSQLKTHSCVLQDGDRPSSVGSFSVRCSRRFCRAESNSTPTPTLTRLDFIPTNRSQLMLSILYSYVLLLQQYVTANVAAGGEYKNHCCLTFRGTTLCANYVSAQGGPKSNKHTWSLCGSGEHWLCHFRP